MKSCLKYFVLIFSFYFVVGDYRCDYIYNKAANGYFKTFIIPATWQDARLRCALEGAVLASPTTHEIGNAMREMISYSFSNAKETEIHTGIHASFSQGDFYSIEGVPLSEMHAKWSPNEPNNLGNNERCLTFNYNQAFADRSCEDTRPYICYRKRTEDQQVNACGTVDPEYNLDSRTNSCYKYHTVPRTFKRAHLACAAEGGHLAIINSATEATVLTELLTKYPIWKIPGSFMKDVIFIGFSDWGERGDWRTIHGQTLTEAGYAKFSQGQPNNVTTGQFCGSIYRTGLLNDLWCEDPFTFICEKSPSYPAICKEQDSIDMFGPWQ